MGFMCDHNLGVGLMGEFRLGQYPWGTVRL